MTPNRHALKILIICGGLVLANGILQYLVDFDLGVSWPHNVLRNWEQVGFFALKGQMVQNPGGHDALEHPQIYPGMRPTSLYPAFFVGRLFAWTGFHALPFHLVLSLAVLISIWYLLGQTDRALFIGGLAILCPGYMMWPTIMDPNDLSILVGIPFAALLWWRLRQPLLAAGDVIFLALLTIAFSLLNWTTALVHAQLFLTLLVSRAVSLRRLALYATAGLIAAGLVVGLGVASKLAEPGRGAASGAFRELLAGYTWGNGGYSDGSGTVTLFVRLAFINALALFPFWIAWAWNWLRCARVDLACALRSLTPLGLAALQAVVMRNYFCHHPWMAAPLLLLGGVFSLLIIVARARVVGTPAAMPPASWRPAWTAAAIAAFGFGVAVLLADHAHGARENSLVALIRADTARSDTILVVSSRDPQLAAIAARLTDGFDRWLVVVDTLPAPQAAPSADLLLSAGPAESGWKLVGSNAGPRRSLPLVDGALAWFTKHISRRKPGDRMELAETYYLYSVAPPAASGVGVKP